VSRATSPAILRRETESHWVPCETVNKLGSPLPHRSEARTIAWVASASPYPRARVRCSGAAYHGPVRWNRRRQAHARVERGGRGEDPARPQRAATDRTARPPARALEPVRTVESTGTNARSSPSSPKPACAGARESNRSAASARPLGSSPRRTPSTHACSRSSARRSSPRFARSCRAEPVSWPIPWPAGASSSR
jgi:hypothetical protein